MSYIACMTGRDRLMNDQLEKTLFDFLEKEAKKDKPILLALSGGPDSLCLLHLLLKYRSKNHLNLHLGHLDHGWREESHQEALLLKQQAETLGLPFHFKRLSIQEKGNLEAIGRRERLLFFSSLCQKFGFQAVILGHHADDQAETVLKKFLEGITIPYISGLKSITYIEGITIWRPFLKVTKKQIATWLERHNLQGFDDYTNRDSQFLRARFRTSIIPSLSEQFGKQVSQSLCRLGEEALELREYLDEKLLSYEGCILKGPFGVCLDLNQRSILSPLEIKFLFRKICEQEQISISHHVVTKVCSLLLEGVANRFIQIANKKIYIDRKCLFFLGKKPFVLPSRMPLVTGKEISYGPWTIRVEPIASPIGGYPCNWRHAWQGICEATVPIGNYELGIASREMAKWWTDHKIPVFLRNQVPVLFSKNGIYHEFLTGKNYKRKEEGNWKVMMLVMSDE